MEAKTKQSLLAKTNFPGAVGSPASGHCSFYELRPHSWRQFNFSSSSCQQQVIQIFELFLIYIPFLVSSIILVSFFWFLSNTINLKSSERDLKVYSRVWLILSKQENSIKIRWHQVGPCPPWLPRTCSWPHLLCTRAPAQIRGGGEQGLCLIPWLWHQRHVDACPISPFSHTSMSSLI